MDLMQSDSIGLGASNLLHVLGPWLIVLIIWEFFWKGLALWHSARRGEPWWFVILLILNTVGILEIVYLFFVAKKKCSTLFSR